MQAQRARSDSAVRGVADVGDRLRVVEIDELTVDVEPRLEPLTDRDDVVPHAIVVVLSAVGADESVAVPIDAEGDPVEGLEPLVPDADVVPAVDGGAVAEELHVLARLEGVEPEREGEVLGAAVQGRAADVDPVAVAIRPQPLAHPPRRAQGVTDEDPRRGR